MIWRVSVVPAHTSWYGGCPQYPYIPHRIKGVRNIHIYFTVWRLSIYPYIPHRMEGISNIHTYLTEWRVSAISIYTSQYGGCACDCTNHFHLCVAEQCKSLFNMHTSIRRSDHVCLLGYFVMQLCQVDRG